MISNTVRLIILLLLVSLVTPDPVTQYVEDTRDLNLADTEDRSPVLQAMDTAQFVLRTAWDFVEEEARTVLMDSDNILRGVRLASLTIMGLYILSSVTALIVPVIIFMGIYSFPDFFQDDVWGKDLLFDLIAKIKMINNK